jgi:hypothetical protein
MAHAQKPDFVFQRNGRVHLNRQGCQFSRLPAAEVCTSVVAMLDTPCSGVVWSVLATHSIRQFPLHFPSRASPCAITFQLDSTTVHVSAESHEITQLSSVLDVPIHINLLQIKDFAISSSYICCNAQCSCFFLIGSIAIISIKQKWITYVMESYWDYEILLTTGWTNVKLMNCRRENHFQLAITTGQYSWDKCFTACCWDLPWKKYIYIYIYYGT